jgi:pimeloyl-ACP methyl ester carboxylesterase
LVLHGGPGPGSVTPLVDHLARDHHVYAPTHPGWDDTTRPAELASVPALARRYRQLISELGLNDVVVIGTSFGGWLAAELVAQEAAEQSTVVGRLVLIDSAGFDVPGVGRLREVDAEEPVEADGALQVGGDDPDRVQLRHERDANG